MESYLICEIVKSSHSWVVRVSLDTCVWYTHPGTRSCPPKVETHWARQRTDQRTVYTPTWGPSSCSPLWGHQPTPRSNTSRGRERAPKCRGEKPRVLLSNKTYFALSPTPFQSGGTSRVELKERTGKSRAASYEGRGPSRDSARRALGRLPCR